MSKKKIPVRYVGAVLDTSGYGSACRSYIGALLKTELVDLTIHPVSFENTKISHGKIQEEIAPLINKPLDYKINLVHLTPENYILHHKKDKYNIGYTVWETDKLPESWTQLCNLMDEIWVPSQWNVDIFKANGVTKPIYKIPHGIEIPESIGALLDIGSRSTYVFYSIFQWIVRKNPSALLKAYLSEFKATEDVCLALKTYRLSTSPKEQEVIKEDIKRIKHSLNLKEYPPIMFFGQLLTAEQIHSLHLRGDCFVLPHKGEGFGIPHAEAMSYGKPVISTNYSGNLEFMNKSNSYLVDYQIEPVHSMIFPNYNAHMNWAEPSIADLKKAMRYVFENQKEAKLMGEKAKNTILENFNWKTIGQLMYNRLVEIQQTL